LGVMRALGEAGRALAYCTAAHADHAHAAPDPAERARHQAIHAFLVPIVKGWCTEMSIEVASLGIQVHGGMGYIEETGAAQYYRDARILTIYEGTTAIQANDLVGRKTARDGGQVAHAILDEIRCTQGELVANGDADLAAIAAQLGAAADALDAVVGYVVRNVEAEIKQVFAGSVPYLKLAGIVLGGWQMARAALRAHQKLKADDGDRQFLQAKVATARFFADHYLSQAMAYRSAIVDGGASVMALEEEQF